jgi:uncharacterized protein (UPF0335 family)
LRRRRPTIHRQCERSCNHQADAGGVTAERLKSIIERVERLEEEKSEVQEQIKEVLGEAKGDGFE